MRLSGVILPALAMLCVSMTGAPAANATALSTSAASVAVTHAVQPVSYYKRYCCGCYRRHYSGRRHHKKHYGYGYYPRHHRRSYHYESYSDYDYPYRHRYRRHYRDYDDYGY